jgi:hypothetical protein
MKRSGLLRTFFPGEFAVQVDRDVHLQIKVKFSKATNARLFRHNSRKDYDTGKLRAEVLLLRCTRFNHSLYRKLSEVAEREGEAREVAKARTRKVAIGGRSVTIE